MSSDARRTSDRSPAAPASPEAKRESLARHVYAPGLWRSLACPICGHAPLERAEDGARCPRCPQTYTYSHYGSLDLRPKAPRKYSVDFEIGRRLPPQNGIDIERFTDPPAAEVDFTGVPLPSHLSSQIMAHFPKARAKDALMLDLGCGNAVHRRVYEHAGFEYVGLDYDAEKAPLMGDAHCLPFRDETFEFILAMALLEHIRHPAVMMSEAGRVLKPGGVLVGTVAFMEPFHGDSFYHHTALGSINSLHAGGLKVTHLAPIREWPVLVALSQMALFPRMPKPLARALVMPLHGLHVLWWKLCTKINCDVPEGRRLRNTAGTFVYRAVKEGS